MDWNSWEPQDRAVLVFLKDGNRLLLIHKKRGLGTGKVNGPGGRIEAGESSEQAARRETLEETGLSVERLSLRGNLRFQFLTGYRLEAEIYAAEGFAGVLTSCDEADPFWHPWNDLPWSSMWADDALWLPAILRGEVVNGTFVFDTEVMIEAKLEIRARSTTTF